MIFKVLGGGWWMMGGRGWVRVGQESVLENKVINQEGLRAN